MGLNTVQAVLTSILNRIQELENAGFSVLTPMSDKTLKSFTGDFLTKIANLVGQGRGGLGDTDLQNTVPLRVRANRSRGMAADILAVAQLANTTSGAPPAVYTEFGSGFVAFEVDIQQCPSPYWVGIMMGIAKPVGVYGVLGYTLAGWTGAIFGSAHATGTTPTNELFGDSYGPSGPVMGAAQAITPF
jgi:hypothetical protein